ncbi:MAG TPA: PQQ-binding-like beta-propeller repeat protein [Saprospiraceae bacterium]|nr:PQQ-binding-like beta-propeller repeat protein [Saprospiraceae bacterium]
MKRIIAIIIFGGSLLSCSCTKEENSIPTSKDVNGVITGKQFIWWNKEEEHDQSIITTPLIFNGGFIAETHQNGRSYMSLQNAKDGKIYWKWDDYTFSYDLALRDPYGAESGFLFFQRGPRTYCINLNNGKTQWKKIQPFSQYSTTGGYETEGFMLQDYPDDADIYTGIKIYDLESGILKDKIIPKYKFKNKNVLDEFGSILGVERIDSIGKIYYLISYQESINDKSSYPLISLYNYTDKKWMYEYKSLSTIELGSQGTLTIINNKIYHSLGNNIICHDLWTGDSLWTTNFRGNFLFGEYMIDNGTLYCAAEGDGYYALDAETGAIKWKGERAPGTSSRMVVLNGVLYYINGGDGRLWALDAATGKTLWRLKSPDGYSFKREINVMQGDGERKGYVLTSTWHGACAYEAER